MSEFSESYHLRSNNTEDSVQLLKRSGLGGYVFPAQRGWVTMVAGDVSSTSELALIQANHGLYSIIRMQRTMAGSSQFIATAKWFVITNAGGKPRLR